MVQLGRTKQVGMGWEDKEGFLDYVEERNRWKNGEVKGRPRSVSGGKSNGSSGGLQARKVAGKRK